MHPDIWNLLKSTSQMPGPGDKIQNHNILYLGIDIAVILQG